MNIIQIMQQAIELGYYNSRVWEGVGVRREDYRTNTYMCLAIDCMVVDGLIKQEVAELYQAEIIQMIQHFCMQAAPQDLSGRDRTTILSAIQKCMWTFNWPKKRKTTAGDLTMQFYFCLIWACTARGDVNLKYLNLKG